MADTIACKHVKRGDVLCFTRMTNNVQVLSMNHAEMPADKNKKTKCAVYLRDLQEQARPPLTLAALHHIAAIAGPRYVPAAVLRFGQAVASRHAGTLWMTCSQPSSVTPGLCEQRSQQGQIAVDMDF